MESRFQIVIIGGGPVGLALAVELGLRGISCALVEQRMEPQPIPKGQNLTQRTLEHFYFWGIVDELRASRTIQADFPGGSIVAYGDLMNDYWYTPTARKVVDSYYFQRAERLPQYRTEQVLREKLRDLSCVDALFGWSARNISQVDERVLVEIIEEDGARGKTLIADYAVGCDGSRSLVRDQIGISMAGADYDQLMVLAVFRSRELHEGLKRFPDAYIYRVVHKDLEGYWQFFGRVDDREGWFFHAPVPADTNRENFDFQNLLNTAAGFEFACSFDHIGFWDMRVAVAEKYQVGRVFIAGDAAHSHPPYGGYGLNNGLEDVANLGWKLAAVLDGWGGDKLLDSYGEERQPVFMETAEDLIANRIDSDRDFFNRFNPERDKEAFERAWKDHQSAGEPRVMTYEPHYEGSSVVEGPANAVCSAHGSHSFMARPGHHLPPRLLSSGRNVFEELGACFTLVALDASDSDVAAFRDAAGGQNIPLRILRDKYDGERKAYEAPLILVRPDQFVAWTGDTAPDDASALMGKFIGSS